MYVYYMQFCSLSMNQLVSKVVSVLSPSLQDLLNKQRAAEIRLEAERRRLRESLEAAEARATRVELGRRSLEGELQRLKLSLGDREVESQTSQERHDALLKQVRQADQRHSTQITTNHLFVFVALPTGSHQSLISANCRWEKEKLACPCSRERWRG